MQNYDGGDGGVGDVGGDGGGYHQMRKDLTQYDILHSDRLNGIVVGL